MSYDHSSSDRSRDDDRVDQSAASAAATLSAGLFQQGKFSHVDVVSKDGIDFPQVNILQTNKNDFARLRFSVAGQDYWDIATRFDRMNFYDQTGGNVMSISNVGNLTIKGSLTQGSSRSLKENIAELDGAEALAAVARLSPVKYRYKADKGSRDHVGFIAEDVPDLVATPDRKGLDPMDIIAVVTRAVQEQQKVLARVVAELAQRRAAGAAG